MHPSPIEGLPPLMSAATLATCIQCLLKTNQINHFHDSPPIVIIHGTSSLPNPEGGQDRLGSCTCGMRVSTMDLISALQSGHYYPGGEEGEGGPSQPAVPAGGQHD